MSIEAMKQALEALNAPRPFDNYPPLWRAYEKTINAAITALRQAIEQAERKEFNPDWDAMAVMVEEQQRMASEIERLKDALNKSELRLHEVAVHCEQVERNRDAALLSIKQAEQAQPVAWKDKTYGNLHHQDFGNSIPLYTTPPPRQPLTDEEIIGIGKDARAVECLHILPITFARAIEAAHGIRRDDAA